MAARAVGAVALITLVVAAAALAAPVKTTAMIDNITRTVSPGDDSYSAKGHITAPEDACLNKRTVHVIERLGPPFDSNAFMGVATTNAKGKWKATWTTRSGPGDVEEAATGVHYIEVDKVKKGKLKCGFARSKEYVVPLPD